MIRGVISKNNVFVGRNKNLEILIKIMWKLRICLIKVVKWKIMNKLEGRKMFIVYCWLDILN